MKRCRLCGSTNIKILNKIKSPYYEQKYSLFCCDDCKSRFFDPKENNVDINQLYKEIADKNKKKYSVAFKRSKFWEDQTIKIKRKFGHKINNILDVGCRTGDFLLHLSEKIERVGVELSEENAKIARMRNLKIYCDFIENIDFKDQFDVITCYAILEHLCYPVETMNKIIDSLRPGGLLVILIPTHECLKEKILSFFNRRWHMYSPPEHLNFYSQVFFEEFFKKNNIEIIDTKYLAGGMFNPFKNIPIVSKIFNKIMYFYDRSLFTGLPIFDHKIIFLKKIVLQKGSISHTIRSNK